MWQVTVTRHAAKRLAKLPSPIRERFDFLIRDLELYGPVRRNWPNFGKLATKGGHACYHCHIKKGHPTYVACWEVMADEVRLMEVYYVGTHENVPY